MRLLAVLFLTIFVSTICQWSTAAPTVFDCRKGTDMYINVSNYKVVCPYGPEFNITFGPDVEIITPVDDCDWVVKVTFSDSVTTIEEDAFYFSVALSIINFGSGINSIGAYAFYYSAIESLEIPDSVISIGDSAFAGASYLQTLDLGNGVQTIDDFAFYGCGISELILPSSLTSIGYYSFAILLDLTSLVINEGLTNIGDSAFLYSYQLENITFPNSVDTIGPYAFAFCFSVSSITWGRGLTAIEEYAFYEPGSGLTTLEFPDSLVTIGDGAFSSCSYLGCNIQTIVFGSALESIGSDAFYDLTSLIEVNFNGNNLLTIGSYAFAYTNLTSLILPEGLLTIDDEAFEYNTELLFVQLPETLTSIGYASFYGCEGLTSIGIPSSVTKIGSLAFSYCTNLECIYWDSSVSRVVGMYAFFQCPLSTCGPSALPTFKPTARPSVSFTPTISMAPTRKPTFVLTATPSLRPVVPPTFDDDYDDDVTFTFAFSMLQWLRGIDVDTFTSRDANSKLIASAIATSTTEETSIILVSLTDVRDADDVVMRRLLSANFSNDQLPSIVIDYQVIFDASSVWEADRLYAIMKYSLINSTFDGTFTSTIHDLASEYSVSDEMYDVYTDYIDIDGDLITIAFDDLKGLPWDKDDDLVDVEPAQKQKKFSTVMIVILLVAGVGGGIWFLVGVAVLWYYYTLWRERRTSSSNRIVPTNEEPARKYELAPLPASGKSATQSQTV